MAKVKSVKKDTQKKSTAEETVKVAVVEEQQKVEEAVVEESKTAEEAMQETIDKAIVEDLKVLAKKVEKKTSNKKNNGIIKENLALSKNALRSRMLEMSWNGQEFD